MGLDNTVEDILEYFVSKCILIKLRGTNELIKNSSLNEIDSLNFNLCI